MPEISEGRTLEMTPLRTYRGFWLPLLLALAIGGLLGAVGGSVEAESCSSPFGPADFRTGLLILIGVVFAIGGLLALGIGIWRRKPKTTYQGLGVLLAGVALPAAFFVIYATFWILGGCGTI